MMRLLPSEKILGFVHSGLNLGVLLASLLSLMALVYEWGFGGNPELLDRLHTVNQWVLVFFLANLSLRPFLQGEHLLAFIQGRLLEYALGIVLLALLLANWTGLIEGAGAKAILYTQVYLAGSQILLLSFSFITLARASRYVATFQIQPSRLVLGTFLLAILFGTALLMLPKATLHPGSLPLVDAAFVATSAVCVTGLSTVDVASTLTPLGQAILLFLIQLGGLGVMTLAGSIGILFGGLDGLAQHKMFRDLLGPTETERVRNLLWKIVILTAVVEALGAVFLWLTWESLIPDPFARAWNAAFHSISAFCNAGFSILPQGLATQGFDNALGGLFVLMLLVVLGATGYPVLSEMLAPRRGSLKWSIPTRIVLVGSGILLIGGSLCFWLLERHHTLGSESVAASWIKAGFLAVMPRTAGFNLHDLSLLSEASLLLMILLMFVGGAPGSTAGGVRITTLAVVAAGMWSVLRGDPSVRMYNREVPADNSLRATTIILLYLFTATLGILSISLLEKASLMQAAFEVVSALSTVGLSLNLTPSLSPMGKIIIMFCMLFGRVGMLTLLWSVFHDDRHRRISHPRTQIPLY